MKRLIFKLLKWHAKKLGFGDYFADLHYKQLIYDYKNELISDYLDVYRCHKKGFYYYTLKWGISDLSEKNYMKYLSDFNYRKLFPINGEYSHWIDDKLTFRLIFSKYSNHIPKYYYHINNDGKILKGIDLYEKKNNQIYTVEDILNLLRKSKILALKKRSGSRAEGFAVLKHVQNKYFINSVEKDRTEVEKYLAGLRDYIIQEYIKQSKEIEEYYSSIRILVIHEKCEMPLIFSAMLYLSEPNQLSKNKNDTNRNMEFPKSKIDIKTGEYSLLENKDEKRKVQDGR